MMQPLNPGPEPIANTLASEEEAGNPNRGKLPYAELISDVSVSTANLPEQCWN